MTMRHVSAFGVYCTVCGLAVLAVALGVVAANIAMLLVLIVMVGVCCLGGKP